jgi:ATP-binding cassette subfamily C protein
VKTNAGLADLEAVQRTITLPVLMAAFDLPWTPIFFAGIFVFHAYLGYLALAGGAVLVVIAIANQYLSRGAQARAAIAGQQAGAMADQIRTEAEMVQAMGMR